MQYNDKKNDGFKTLTVVLSIDETFLFMLQWSYQRKKQEEQHVQL